MYSDNKCAVCGCKGQTVLGPDEVRYCPTCYQAAYPKAPREQRLSAARQQRILDLTLRKIKPYRREDKSSSMTIRFSRKGYKN